MNRQPTEAEKRRARRKRRRNSVDWFEAATIPRIQPIDETRHRRSTYADCLWNDRSSLSDERCQRVRLVGETLRMTKTRNERTNRRGLLSTMKTNIFRTLVQLESHYHWSARSRDVVLDLPTRENFVVDTTMWNWTNDSSTATSRTWSSTSCVVHSA